MAAPEIFQQHLELDSLDLAQAVALRGGAGTSHRLLACGDEGEGIPLAARKELRQEFRLGAWAEEG